MDLKELAKWVLAQKAHARPKARQSGSTAAVKTIGELVEPVVTA